MIIVIIYNDHLNALLPPRTVSQTHTSTDLVGQLYMSHHAWLHGWLRKKLGCVHSSADVAQDVFLRVLASRDRLCGVREPRAYLTTTAQHLLVYRMRREVLEKGGGHPQNTVKKRNGFHFCLFCYF